MKRRHISKVFLDSRYALSDGKTFMIPGEALLLEPTSRVWLGEFTCVASWDTLDDSNNSFVISETGQEHQVTTVRTVSLPTGPHDIESLRSSLEDALNATSGEGMGVYVVERSSTGTGGAAFRTLTVSNTYGTFRIPPASNKLSGICNWPYGDTDSSTHTSTFVDVRRCHSIYVHSDVGNHNSITPTGIRSVLAKIPVSVGYGGLVQAQLSGSEHDFVEAGCYALASIKLSLHDAAGRELDLNGTSWSCTLVFER